VKGANGSVTTCAKPSTADTNPRGRIP